MSKMVAKFKINVNESADLPKDYKKNNPLAKKSDYPALVGYTALHLGKFVIKLLNAFRMKTHNNLMTL